MLDKKKIIMEFKKELLLVQEKYLYVIQEEFGEYYNLCEKLDVVTLEEIKYSDSINSFYNNITNKCCIYVSDKSTLESFSLSSIHEYIHYISAKRIGIKVWTGVRYNFLWPWSQQFGTGLNEAITEYLTELLIYKDKKEKTYERGVEIIDRLSDIVGLDNVVKNYFSHNVNYFVKLFLLPIKNKFINKKEFLEAFDYIVLSDENPVGNSLFVAEMTHFRKALADIEEYLS